MERKLSKVKSFEKYFFHVKPNPIKSEIQRLIIQELDKLGMTQRRFAAEFTDYSTATYGTWRRQEVVMGLDIMEKILSNYPEVKTALIKYLGGNTEENLTEVQQSEDIKEKIKAAGNAALVEHLKRENERLWGLLNKERGGGKGKARVSDN